MSSITMMLLARRLRDDRSGVAAIEFALVALPLILTILVILECAVQYFVWTSLDLAVQQAARQIRTGQVQELALDAKTFKASICKQISNLFGCPSRLLLKIDVVKDMKTAVIGGSVNSAGMPVVNETYNIGKSGDFVVVQAFFPWPSFNPMVSLAGSKNAKGEYLLQSATLFRNEPF